MNVNTAGRLGAFAAAVALLSGGAAAAGGAIDPGAKDSNEPAAHAPAHQGPEGDEAMNATHGEAEAPAADPVRGLALADDGLQVVVADAELRPGRAEELRFRVVGEDGRTVRDFDVEHEKRMHLILARRDLTGFQHLHPEQHPDGSWSADVRIDDAGSYRLFADFSQGGEARTLASDLRVDGAANLEPLPAPEPIARSGGYAVRLDSGRVEPGRAATLRFSISQDGKPVDTDPYLGAGGHLVALREGDLAFLHVHPTGDGTDFAATFPTAGAYRLFLQFKHDGRVRTVAFTQVVK